MEQAAFERIEPIIERMMHEAKIPGLALGIVKDGSPIYVKGFGKRDLEKDLPFTTNTIFPIASITKSFTALAIMQLVEQEKLSLDDSPSQYIDFQLGVKDAPITIHHMLSHSSGVPSLSGLSFAGAKKMGLVKSEIPLENTKDYLRFLNRANNEVFGRPGDHYFYNNDMYVILGMIIEEVTKTKYDEHIKENILSPLGMHRSTFRIEEVESDTNSMIGYLPPIGEGPRQAFSVLYPKLDITGYQAPGALLSTIDEMVKYLEFLLGGDSFETTQLVQQSSLEKTWTPYIKIPLKLSKDWGETGYGYGWFVEKDFMAHTLIRHSGLLAFSSSYLAFIPNERIGLIIGSNCAVPQQLALITRGILALLLGSEFDQAVPQIAINETLERLTGRYETYNGLLVGELYLQNGVLFGKMKDFLSPEPVVVPLAPKNIETLEFYVPTAVPGSRFVVQFFIDPKSGEISATYERYYVHKIPGNKE